MELTVESFIDTYKPIENPLARANDRLTDSLGKVVYDKLEYAALAGRAFDKTIWSVFMKGDKYKIIPGIYHHGDDGLVGYIIGECPYHRNDIANLELIV